MYVCHEVQNAPAGLPNFNKIG